jgi:hypothetical protein
MHPEIFYIGPFKIKINDQHCQNIHFLSRNQTITFGYDESYKRIIIESPKVQGGWIETAEVEIDKDELKPSIIYPDNYSKYSIDDLCLLLSFITGRIVSFEGNISLDHYNPNVHVEKVVHYGYFSRENFCWKQLQAIKNKGLSLQFYYLIMAYQANDLVAKAVYCNNALNTVYDKWYAEWNEENKIEFVEKNMRTKIKCNIGKILEENSIKETKKEDILNRVDTILFPSAIYKIKHFLRGINLYPKYDNQEMHKRLTWINKVRNNMAHTGALPKDNRLTDSRLRQVVSSVISLVLIINQYYFGCKVLELNDPYLDYIRKLITRYFYEGKFSGISIFNESYEEYMERTKKEWLSE